MEYYQMTINDWLAMKQKLQAELLGVRRSFVRIGYILRKIDESKGYENDGYKSITEWARGEYGLEGTTVSRFMSINREYSIGGYSEELLPEFEDFKRSQLEEMLKLPIADREMIRPEAARQDIRALKQFNKQEPAAGVADDIHQLVRKFFDENETILKEVYAVIGNVEAVKEVVNPSGNRSYRKGAFFMMMYEDGIKLKKFGESPETYTWEDFIRITKEVFDDSLPDEEIAPAQILEREEKKEVSEKDAKENAGSVKRNSEQHNEDGNEDGEENCECGKEKHAESTKKNEIAKKSELENKKKANEEPEWENAQKKEKLEDDELPGQDNIMNHAEYMPENYGIVEKPFGTRKEYMDSLTAWGMALYLKHIEAQDKALMYDAKSLEKYLKEKVDKNGEIWEE